MTHRRMNVDVLSATMNKKETYCGNRKQLQSLPHFSVTLSHCRHTSTRCYEEQTKSMTHLTISHDILGAIISY